MALSAKFRLQVMTDANVLVAGNAFPRWPYEVLMHAAGDFQLFLCPYIIDEARRTMLKAFPDLASRFERFLDTCPHTCVNDPSKRLVRANHDLVRSVKDVPVALAARKAIVAYLVTSDKDLTVVDATSEAIRQCFTPILPALFLREVMGWTSNELEAIRHRTWRDLETTATITEI